MLSKARVLRTQLRQPRRRRARRGWRGVSRELTRAAGTHASSDLKRSSDGAHEETVLTWTRVDAGGRLRALEAAFVRMNTRRTTAGGGGGGGGADWNRSKAAL
jgi:hypothetical protein